MQKYKGFGRPQSAGNPILFSMPIFLMTQATSF